MALIDFFSQVITEEGGRCLEDDLPLVKEKLDIALQCRETGKQVNKGDHLLADLDDLFKGAGIKTNLDELMAALKQRYDLTQEMVKPLEDGIDSWIIQNQTRLDAFRIIRGT